ncbi:hypothetical protein [Pseudomonas sp. LFM046]|uniref:hypothetical protein n=1 Tax=Pseudomonas sp. LFM046 TaxID=1608357 RepID=UPI0011AFCD87|nr:hypothetical protein [Pseudomonas sp. LFM046]
MSGAPEAFVVLQDCNPLQIFTQQLLWKKIVTQNFADLRSQGRVCFPEGVSRVGDGEHPCPPAGQWAL